MRSRGASTHEGHIDYLIEVRAEVATKADALPGYRIIMEPKTLRHLTASFESLHQ